MTAYDIFNGDADGICALQQLRLNKPLQTSLVTGIKRDINLLSKVKASDGDTITVLDISFDKNREGVQQALEAGAEVFYADHHFTGELIESDSLELHINTDANTCTSLIINEYLSNKYHAWAIAGAYGDNLYDSADKLADQFHISLSDREQLKLLGTCLNYNGYGFTIQDLVYNPADLFKLVQPYENPLEFVKTKEYDLLLKAYQNDLENTHKLTPLDAKNNGAIYLLPNEPWARRVNGVFSNDLARENPARAHAVLVDCGENCYRVSVRAPMENKTGADELCRQFESGGGRKAAAGINHMPEHEMERFKTAFFGAF